MSDFCVSGELILVRFFGRSIAGEDIFRLAYKRLPEGESGEKMPLTVLRRNRFSRLLFCLCEECKGQWVKVWCKGNKVGHMDIWLLFSLQHAL